MRFLHAGLLATLVVVALVAAVTLSAPRPQELESNGMLEPYFAWKAEQAASAQDNTESTQLSTSDDNSDDDLNSLRLASDTTELSAASPIPHVAVSHAKVSEEMAAKFKDRDLLAAIRKQLREDRQPRATAASEETARDAEMKMLGKQILALERKKQAALAKLHAAERQADPLLRRANRIFNRAHNVQRDYQAALSRAHEDMATGEADLQKAVTMRHEFFAEEQPVEAAQVAADNADQRYRADALRFASEMLRTEKIGKDKKLRSAAEKKLNSLRQQLNLDEVERTQANKKLEAAQSAMHVQAGLQDYDRWRLRGEKLVNRGKSMLKQAKSIKLQADEWKEPLKSAQSSAAAAETKVHALRVAEQKIEKAEGSLAQKKNTAAARKAAAASRLKALEEEDVALREKGAKLMRQYHALESDISKREANRAHKTAEMAESNSQTLKQLLSQN